MKLIRPLPLLLLCALLLAGCGQEGGALQEQETAQTQTGPTWESRTPSEAFQGIQGCAVLYDLGTDHYTLYQEDLCRTQVSPCSTFKILSTLMGLHTGVLTGPESTMTYSGIQYPVAAWNGNLTLAEAFQSSCVWYFRQVIDQVGQASVAQQLAALDYGNQDISQWEGSGQNQSPELNGFWIDASLKISPLEQVQVLTKVFEGRSQYTQEEVDTLRTIMLVQDDGTRQVYGKTGSGFGETGWFVGFQEKAGARTYFAVYLADENRTVSGSQAREVAFALLKETASLA